MNKEEKNKWELNHELKKKRDEAKWKWGYRESDEEPMSMHKTCEKCGKFNESRLMISESFYNENSKPNMAEWYNDWVIRLVCEECKLNKKGTCDLCEKTLTLSKISLSKSECTRQGCKRKLIHKHLVCIECESIIKYNHSECYICHVERKHKKVHLHQFNKNCGIKQCINLFQHEHYLCQDCNKDRRIQKR